MSHSQLLDAPQWVSPPGETILDILESRELTIEQFAGQIGRSASAAQKLLDGDFEIDGDLARQLAKVLGSSQEFWMAREHDYRASIAPPEKAQVANLEGLLERLPLNDMRKFGWLRAARSREDKIAECLEFFGVSSLAQWQGRYENAFLNATYRRSAAYACCEVATIAWLRQGEVETKHDEVARWDPSVLKNIIPDLRRLTWYKSPVLFLPKLKELLGEAGVKFAVVRAPKGCTASGAVRVISDGIPHMQLSFRYLSDEQFWFTLFHEIAHLLLHFDEMPIFENGNDADGKIETEANEYAAKIVIPTIYYEELLTLGGSRFPIIKFAKKVGIAPGLVVGQLQHHGIIRYNQMQHLKRRFRWTN